MWKKSLESTCFFSEKTEHHANLNLSLIRGIYSEEDEGTHLFRT